MTFRSYHFSFVFLFHMCFYLLSHWFGNHSEFQTHIVFIYDFCFLCLQEVKNGLVIESTEIPITSICYYFVVDRIFSSFEEMSERFNGESRTDSVRIGTQKIVWIIFKINIKWETNFGSFTPYCRCFLTLLALEVVLIFLVESLFIFILLLSVEIYLYITMLAFVIYYFSARNINIFSLTCGSQ